MNRADFLFSRLRVTPTGTTLLQWMAWLCLGWLTLAIRLTAAAPPYEVIYHFGTGGDGTQPQGALIQGKNGDFYGTTFGGGSGKGTVFRMTAGGEVTILYRFTGKDDGAHPYGPLVLGPDGNFYGTGRGGADSRDDSGPETVFRVTPSGQFTTLHALTFEEGIYINGLTLGGDGNFYGTTGLGGGNDSEGRGTFFRITPQGEFTTLHYFTYQNIAGTPQYGLTEGPDGCLYGGTYTNSVDNTGTLFKVTRDGTVTRLREGVVLVATMTLGSDGALYGQDPTGLFRLGTDGAFTELHRFTAADGYDPRAPLVLSGDGAFYGATTVGSSEEDTPPTLFRFAADGTFTPLRSFDGADGQSAPTALTLGRDGNLYAVASQEDDDPQGEVSRLTTDGTRALILHQFTGSEGILPGQALAQGPDGTLYGVTRSGGRGFRGTLFALSPSGSLTTLHAFANDNVAVDVQDLVVARDGSVYGWTHSIVFRVSPDGEYRVLYPMNAAGSNGTITALTAGPDGSVYGALNGFFGTGSVFRLGEDGTFTILYSSDRATGGVPSDLTQGSDGRIYGTTRAGGKHDAGTIFALATNGTFRLLHDFNGKKSSQPTHLIQGADGALYGITQRGAGSAGAVFRVTTDGKFSILHDFSANGPSYEIPQSLLAGGGGQIYGVTTDTFVRDDGQLFAVSTTGGDFSTVHLFPDAASDGVKLPGGLVYGRDGNLYGVGSGGANGGGVIYRVQLPGVPQVRALVVNAQSVAELPGQDGTSARVTLELTEPLTEDMLVHYTVGGTATPGVDYVARKGTAKIKAGRISKSINVQATGNLGGAAQKTVILTLTPDANYGLLSSTPLELTLLPHG